MSGQETIVIELNADVALELVAVFEIGEKHLTLTEEQQELLDELRGALS